MCKREKERVFGLVKIHLQRDRVRAIYRACVREKERDRVCLRERMREHLVWLIQHVFCNTLKEG